MNCIKLLFILLLCSLASKAQHIVVRDKSGQVVNDDTLTLAPGATQKPPNIEISCYLYPQNMGTASMTLRAKKTEFGLGGDVQHAICFAGLCYPATVFTSINTVTAAPGYIDSGFSGHYLYNPATHTPSKDLVAYVFYDENNPSDSAIVYVMYNSMTTGLPEIPASGFALRTYPNPAGSTMNFHYRLPGNAHASDIVMTVTNTTGQMMGRQILADTEKLSINTSDWSPGIYFYSFFYRGSCISKGRFAVAH